MNSHPGMEKFFTWLLNHSLQAGLLVILVLFVQWIFRGRLTSRWRFALWWVFLVRLILPVGPQSAVSLFNYFHPSVSVAPHYQAAQPMSQPRPDVQKLEATRSTAPDTSVARNSEPNAATIAPAESKASSPLIAPQHSASLSPSTAAPIPTRNYSNLILPAAATIWVLGMAMLAIYVLIQITRFQWRLSRSTVTPESELNDLLSECQREFGVSRRIELLETDAVGSPALFGLFKLRLLLPKGFAARFSRNELRYVFLHELAHVKRGDLWLNWLVTALQIAHWFNPLIWFGFARLRSDRELACDELALLHAGEKTGTRYGETVVKLLEGLSHPAAIPGLVGILEDKKQMRRRILMIANFKKPGRWSALAVLLVAAIAAATLTDAQTETPSTSASTAAPKLLTGATSSGNNAAITLPEEDVGTGPRPDLVGTVRAKGGAPLSATVFISTAAPKTGTSTFCPSCYADCTKSATADSQGEFQIKSLNPQLVFRIVAVAKGYKPKFVTKIDPATGPVAIELEPINAAVATPDRSLRGRVLDHKGTPIEGAAVQLVGIESKDGGGRWGTIEGVDPLAVTDAEGKFLITAQKPFDMLAVKVEARRLAPQSFTKLASGAPHDLTLTEGASLTGRVLLKGNPLKGVSVGVSAIDRTAGSYLGHFEVGTSANGVFAFVNLPPDADFYIYTLMNTMKDYGAVPVQKFHTAKDGNTTEIGGLVATPAHRLQGRVVLSDGQPVPPNTRLSVSRENAWDSLQITLDEKGGFDISGIPNETISLSVRIKGYRISSQNKSLEQLNFRLSGRVDHDITGLVYLLEPGPDIRPDFSGSISEADLPQNRPLRGAEGGIDHSQEWKISGHVIDSETKEPLPSFRVTPGESDSFDRVRWDSFQSTEATNGTYSVYVKKRISQPMLKIEAVGYLPGGITLVPEDSNSADIALTKGTGPSGTVVDSEGKPVAGASLVLLGNNGNQAGLNSQGELTAYGSKAMMTNADASGHFQFQPEWGMNKVAASSSKGFAMATIEQLAAHPEIRLEPLAKITGTLKRTSAFGTNEDLDLAFAADNSRELPRIYLNLHAVTDSQGHFSFEGVPSGSLQLSYRVPMGNGSHSWLNEPLQKVDVKPGQTLDLQVNAADRTPQRASNFEAPPPPKRIPGSELKGFILLPSGKPAADVDVALQVEGSYLALEKGTLTGNSPRENGLMVSSGADGSFTLPLFESAQSVVAANLEGFAQVSLESFKASPIITLQQWGRVEGTIQINHRPGSNETIALEQVRYPYQIRQKTGTNEFAVYHTNAALPPISYVLRAKTDERGHFAISFVPPEEIIVAHVVRSGNNSFAHRPMGNVTVKAGDTTAFNFSAEGRSVTGKVTFSGTNSPELEGCHASLATPVVKLMIQMQSAKTIEERKALFDSDAFQAIMKNHQEFPATLNRDGSFSVDDIPPGNYEFTIQPRTDPVARGAQFPTNLLMFVSAENIVVPPVSEPNDNTPVNAGTIEIKSFSLPTQPIPAYPIEVGTRPPRAP